MPGYDERASILQGAGDTIFKLVLERSTPEQWAEWLRAPLEHAAGTADYDLVKKLLKAGADGSAGWKGCHGQTLLHAAAEGGDGQVISTLIRAGAGADKNVRAPQNGRTPLHVAVVLGNAAATKALIMTRADVDILDANSDAPLHLAIERGHVGIAQDLLIKGADYAVRGSKGGYPIHLAASRGQDDVVLSLVQSEANLDCLNVHGQTPLAVAMHGDRLSTVEALLAGGADVHSRMGSWRDTVLHFAAEFNKVASISALVEAGANIEARSTNGCTPLSYVAICGSLAAMLALLHLGANVNAKTNNGRTPLHAVCHGRHAEAADLLLRWGADENIVDSDGKTPSQLIPDIAQASEEERPRLERLTKLLAHAPQDRAWRRRGFVMMCRSHQDRLRLVVEIPDSAGGAIGQSRKRPIRRARRGEVKVEVGVGGAHGGGAGSSGMCAMKRAGDEGVGSGFDGVAAWLMVVDEANVFRKVLGFL